MKAFTLQLQDATRSETIVNVTSFVGEDASGSFGILAGHARMLASLSVGLARFRIGDGAWKYLALPGGVLCFDAGTLTVSARRYLLDEDYHRISAALQQQLLMEEEELKTMKDSLRRMEQEVFKRLSEMGHEVGP